MAADEHEAVALIDLRDVDGDVECALFEFGPGGGDGALDDVDFAAAEKRAGAFAFRGETERGLDAFAFEESARRAGRGMDCRTASGESA